MSSRVCFPHLLVKEKAITFLSKEGRIVPFSRELLQYVPFLEMLHRHREKDIPIKTGILEHDLMLVKAILEIGLYPCSHQISLRSHGFDDFPSLIDYMGIVDIEEDLDNDHINRFLAFMGLEPDCGDDDIDPYEGWTQEMIEEQQEDDRRVEMYETDETDEMEDFETMWW